MTEENPRTRYGMVGGVLAVVIGFALITLGRLGASEIALLSGGALVVTGLVVGNVSAVADAWYLRDTDIGSGVVTTLIMVVLFGPLWVAVALVRRRLARPEGESYAELAGRRVARLRQN